MSERVRIRMRGRDECEDGIMPHRSSSASFSAFICKATFRSISASHESLGGDFSSRVTLRFDDGEGFSGDDEEEDCDGDDFLSAFGGSGLVEAVVVLLVL